VSFIYIFSERGFTIYKNTFLNIFTFKNEMLLQFYTVNKNVFKILAAAVAYIVGRAIAPSAEGRGSNHPRSGQVKN